VLKQEIEMLAKLRHPNLVLFIGICDSLDGNTVILTELMSCSLYDLIEVRKSCLELPDVLDISIDIANGLNYLHSHSPTIIHRDISAKNILLGGRTLKRKRRYKTRSKVRKSKRTNKTRDRITIKRRSTRTRIRPKMVDDE
jgi:serine/threonine protein kinase